MDTLINFIVFCLAIYHCRAQIIIDKLSMCETNKSYPITIVVKINSHGEKQTIDGTMIAKKGIDQNTLCLVEVFLDDGGNYNPLMTQQGTYCNIRSNFMGEFANELEKAAGVSNSCNLSTGEYKITNYQLNLEKLKFKLFPNGKVLIKSTLQDPNSQEIISCIDLEFTLKGEM